MSVNKNIENQTEDLIKRNTVFGKQETMEMHKKRRNKQLLYVKHGKTCKEATDQCSVTAHNQI